MPKKRLVQKYSKDANSSPSCLEVHTGFFRLSMKEVFDVYFLSPFWKRFPYYKHLLILGTTWCIHLNCFYNSHLLLQVVHCRKYPTISSYFRVTLPIFGTEVSKKICSIKPKKTKLILLLINDPIIGSKNLLKISSDFKANIILNI